MKSGFVDIELMYLQQNIQYKNSNVKLNFLTESLRH